MFKPSKNFGLMGTLSLDGLSLGNTPASLALSDEGLSILSSGHSKFIEKQDFKNFSVFHGRKNFCLRVTSENAVYDLLNVQESDIKHIRAAISQNYGMNLMQTELERLDTIRGTLTYTNSIVSLQNKNEIFSIPKSAIKQAIELDEDLELHIDGAELVFTTTSNVSQFIGDNRSNEICIIGNVSCINPRSKSTLIFFSEYFLLKGSSYDHSIFYSNIEEIFLLQREEQAYFIIKLDACIMQGHTKYDSIVFLLNDREIEVAARGSDRLKSYYSGPLLSVLPEIVESITQIQAQESSMSFKCTSKVNEGYLYFLENSLQFLPKSINIPIADISYVEFSRINLSIAQAKTFDMTVVSSKVYPFNGIQKSSFSEMEVYFSRKGVKIVSEVIDESISEGSSTEDEGSDLSDILASDEE